MRIMHLLPAVFLAVAFPLMAPQAAPLDDIKMAFAKGEKMAKTAKRGSKRRRVKGATQALEQYSFAFRAIQAANLGGLQPELLKKVRGAIAELNGLDIVKRIKADLRAELITALEEGRNAEAVALLERLLSIDARDAGVEQALRSLREGLGRGSQP